LKKGKTACIFYDNPVAGNIYKRIGFKKIGHGLLRGSSRRKRNK